MTDEQVAYAVTRGCTTTPQQVRVIYNDGSRFLVKWPPGRNGRVFRKHTPAWVMLYELPFPASGDVKGKEVHSCDKTVNPTLTAGVFHALVVKLGLDPAFIRTAKQRTSVAVRPIARGRKGGWPLSAPSRLPRPKPYTRHYPAY